MKEDIHPKYYPEAVVRCACGNTWTTGSTLPEVRTDVCSACHPFFTGEQRIVDSEGRVDRFYRRLRQAQAAQGDDVSADVEDQVEEIEATEDEASQE
jgi:large subunit ribosomal protein L31